MGKVGLDLARQARLGQLWLGQVGHGTAGVAWPVAARRGSVRYGVAGKARRGKAR